MREVGSEEERWRVASANSTRTRLEGGSASSSAAAKTAATKLRFLRETFHKSNRDNTIVSVHQGEYNQSFRLFSEPLETKV